jgi:hypothetical protein
VLDWTLENLSADDVALQRSIYEPLTESVRALIDATIRTEVDAESVAAAKLQIDAATARLRSEQLDGPYGIRFTADGDQMPWGNVVIAYAIPSHRPRSSRRKTTAACSPTSISAQHMKGRPATYTEESPRWCSTTSLALREAVRRSPGSPAPSRCATCA